MGLGVEALASTKRGWVRLKVFWGRRSAATFAG